MFIHSNKYFRQMPGAPCTDPRRLRRHWKRAARQWARPYPYSRSWGLVFITILFSVIAIAYYFFWAHLVQRQWAYTLKPHMLSIVGKEPSPASFHKPRSISPESIIEDNPPLASDTLQGTGNAGQDVNAQPIHSIDTGAVSFSPPKACLAMIMKNEGPILPRLFESIKGFVSEYCVVDTGSTDDTIDVLRSMDMPGLLVEEPFVNFAVTRNFLLDTCRQRMTCDYLVLLDADMVLRVSPEWDWAKLDGKDVYDIVQVSGLEYANVRMIRRTVDKIKVVGSTHEYYDVPAEYSHKLLPKHLIYIDDVGDGNAKGDKFERDERLLRAELEKDSNNVRTVFYLANTLKDQGKYEEAIPLYERRATMGGWYAEADYSLYMLSTSYLGLGDFEKAQEYAERAAFGGAAQRAEPLYFLALYLHRRGQYELAWHYATLASTIPKPDVSRALFISTAIYDYWIAYEQASLCRNTVIFQSAPQLCLDKVAEFLENPNAPDHLRTYISTELQTVTRLVA